MSGTLSATPSTSIASLLGNLQQQQEQVPVGQRGLAKELEALRRQLDANPALEADPAYLTQVAWLVQDWQKFSGTGQQPALSPVLQAGLDQMSAHYPDLENPNLHQLLGQTADLHDQQLVSVIRATAMEVAQMPPEHQTAFMVGQATENLMNKMLQAGTTPVVEVEAPVQATQPPAARGAPDLQEPTQREDDLSQNSTPMTEEEDQRIRQKDVERSEKAEQQEPNVDQSASSKHQENDQETQQSPSPEANPSKTPQARVDQARQPEQAANPAKQEQALGAAAQPSQPTGSIMSQTANRFANWAGGRQAQSDARRIDKLVRDVDQDISRTKACHQTLKDVAAPFFAKLEKTAREENTTVRNILAETGQGGKHEDLGQEFYKERLSNPDVGKAYEQLTGALNVMKRNVLSLRAEAAQRDAAEDPAVKLAEQRVGEVGLDVENVPGIEPGKNLIQSIGDIVEKLVEKTRAFLGLGNNPDQNRDSEPSR